ncbi:unnamed protein product [Calypogeia fissa]
MVLTCLSRSGLPGHTPHGSVSDVLITVSSKSQTVVAVEALHNSQATGTVDGKVSQTLHCKFSSSFHGSRTSEELTSASSAKSAWRDVLLCAVASLARVDGSSAIKVGAKLPKEFPSWRGDDNVDEKTQLDPILYDKRDPPTDVYAPGRRIVAIGDVHGDLPRTEWALQLAGVLSADGLGRWIGGSTVLVQVGDILDRGQDEIAILSLLHNLSQQAQRRGGAVFQINGNHETMNVEGDFRFVEPGGFEEAEDFTEYCEEVHDGDYEAAFAGWYIASKKRKATRLCPSIVSWIFNPMKMQKGAAARAFLFSPGGPLARKLSQHGVVLKVNGWLFAHGGVLPHHVEYGLKRLNEEVTQWMRGDQSQASNQTQLPFMAIRGYDSVVWSRLYSRDDNFSPQDKLKAQAVLEATLEAVGAKALVVGHTPQPYGANCECKGQVWRIDVGMSSGVLNAEPEVLEMNGNHAQVLSGRSCDPENATTFKFTDVQF